MIDSKYLTLTGLYVLTRQTVTGCLKHYCHLVSKINSTIVYNSMKQTECKSFKTSSSLLLSGWMSCQPTPHLLRPSQFVSSSISINIGMVNYYEYSLLCDQLLVMFPHLIVALDKSVYKCNANVIKVVTI